jgi:molybdate transport system regulatory protein
MTKLFLRLDLGGSARLGPGKVRLLEFIEELGSISAAGRAMKMSYRRAWLLVDSLNRSFKRPVVAAQHGGTAGGGARLTDFGKTLVEHYRAMEAETEQAIRKRVRALQRNLRSDAG